MVDSDLTAADSNLYKTEFFFIFVMNISDRSRPVSAGIGWSRCHSQRKSSINGWMECPVGLADRKMEINDETHLTVADIYYNSHSSILLM